MPTICPHCGADSPSGHGPGICEHCREHTSHVGAARDEDSGIIDIHAIQGALHTSRAIPPVQPFQAGALGDPTPQPAPRRRARRVSQAPLHALLGVLVCGAVGLVGAVVHSASHSPHTSVRIVTTESMQPSAALDDLDADASLDEVEATDEADAIEIRGRHRDPRRGRGRRARP